MSITSDIFESVEKKLGYVFKDRHLLDMALTHASLHQKTYDNERLEFLGDRVLGMVIADMLYRRYPDEAEGSLAKRHTALVQQPALVSVARTMHLQDEVRAAGNTVNGTILSDALEALIAAIYIDGGYGAALAFITTHWKELLDSHQVPPEDPKTLLQEWVQEKGLPLPVYKIVSKTGSDHAPMFTVSVTVESHGSFTASSPSKRAGEKQAALLMLQKVGAVP